MPVTISGSASSSFTDSDADGARDPGETIHNVVQVVNSGDTDALNVTVTDPLDGSTIVPGSVQITPVAVDDSFNITGNTPITISKAALLGNDIDPDGNEANLTVTVVANGANGTVTDNGDGTVTFIPTTGLDAGQTASFTYTVTDEQGHTNVAGYEGTVTLTVTDVVWYVNAGAAPGGDGSYTNPFSSLSSLNGAGDVDSAGETIFVYANGAVNGSITLENGQALYGDGHAMTVNGLSIGNSASNSTISASSGTVVTLASGNTIDGINLVGTGGAAGLSGSNFGTLTVSNTAIDASGSGLSLTTGTVAGSGFTSVDSDGGTNNVNLNGVNGTVNLGGGALSGATGASFNVVGGTAAIDYNGTISQTNNAAAVSVSGGHTGSATFDGNVSATNGTGLQFDNADGSYDFNGNVSLNGGDAGVDIVNGSGGTFTFDGAGNAITHNNAGDAFTINGGNAVVTYNGNITDNNGNAVNINAHTGGNVTFQNGQINSNGGGIDVTNNSGGTVTFNTQTTLSTGSNTAVNLTNNGGATINFATTGNGLDITTSSGVGFNATGGGTVSVTGSGNTVTTTSGTAVNVTGTTIGAGGLNWQSISTTGAATGVNLANTGSGAFTVTGTGSDDSGGTISGATTGYNLSNTGALNLTQVNIVNAGDDGIFGSNVNGLLLNSVEIDGIANEGGSGQSNFDRGAEFSNLTGTATVTNSTFSNTAGHAFNVYNSSGQLNLTVTGSTFSGSQIAGAGGDDGMLIEANDTSTIIASVTGSTFSNNEGDHFQFATNGGASTSHITFSGNTLTNSPGSNAELLGGGITISPSGSSDVTFAVQNNNMTGNNQGGAIDITTLSSTSAMHAQGTISGNTVGNPGVANSGSAQAVGISVENNGNGTLTALVQNNNVYQWNGNYGIEIFSRAGTGAGGILNATVIGNTVANPGAFALNAIRVTAGTSLDTDTGTVNVDIQNNNADTTLSQDIRISARAQVDVFFAGYGGAIDDTAAIDAYLEARNPGGENASVAILGGDPDLRPAGAGSVPLPGAPLNPLLAVPTPDAPLTPTPAPTSTPTPTTGGETAPTPTPTPTPTDPSPADPTPTHPVIVEDGVLSQAELDWFVEAAIQRWIAAGASEAQVAAMRATEFSVTDMTGIYLGTAQGDRVEIDADGAGFGWFLDRTPGEDGEFTGSGTRLTGTGAAATQMDLLTTILHELGHRAGLEDSYNSADRDDLMYGYATLGERRLPAQGQAADASGEDHDHDHAAYMLGPVNVGTLPAGTAIEIYYDSIVNSFNSQVIPTPYIRNITVTGSNFANYNIPAQLNIDTLTIGNAVFFDANKNGLLDGGDTGINGVTLSLFADADNNGVADGAAIATTTTAGGGLYSFTSLAQGTYIVQVDASNFNVGGPLAGLGATASGGDPDNNIDNDSNGVAAGGAVRAGSITIDYNQEPVAGTGNDTNNTVDFGFITPNVAPVITNVDGDIVTFTEGGSPVRLDASTNGLVSDSDSADFSGGSLTAEITANEVSGEDVLLLLTGGAITLSGLDVLVNGVTIGTITSGGTAGDPWSMSLNGNATPSRVQEVLRALAYSNSNGGNPSTAARTVTITVVDGDGTAGGGDDSTSVAVTVNVTGTDDAPVAQNDQFFTDELTSETGNLTANNGSGADTDVDGPALAVTAVNGSALNVGTQITLASGALLTVNANGTFSYDPNGAFQYVPGSASGASNLIATDSFTYSLGGNTATVTIDISGVDNDDTLQGSPGTDVLNGGVGINTMSYANATGGITVSLAVSGPQNTGGAGTDSLSNIRNLTGSNYADNLTGNNLGNVIDGGAGIDLMTGLGGNDIYYVDMLGDLAVEAQGGGDDEVRTLVNYSVIGQFVERLTIIGTADINVWGNTLDNVITGNSGINELYGDGGNDTYYVQNTGDLVIENANGGNDIVFASVTFSIAGQHIERLTLTGTAVGGTGNSLDNILTGNAVANYLAGAEGNDTIDGAGGADTMVGGLGNDDFIVDNVGEVIVEYDGEGDDSVTASVSYSLVGNFVEDLILTSAAGSSGTGNGLDNTITGNIGNDVLRGLGGADTLIGGTGTDTMYGGAGNDIYIVDNVGDVTIELANEGTDTVETSVTYYLTAQFVENLTLTGGGNIGGTGNGLDNVITGNAGANDLYGREGNDTLNGGLGADLMRGEGGDDTYYVDQLGDLAIEFDNQGTDEVIASISYDLAGQYVENLSLTGTGTINGNGNSLANTIIGNGMANFLNGREGNDTLNGGGGDDRLAGGDGLDTLTGGAGADRFYFSTALGAGNVDDVTDFTVGTDEIMLSREIFSTLASTTLAPSQFVTGPAALDATDRIIYNPVTGELSYDADGSGAGAAVVFATLDPLLGLSASDFTIYP